MISAKVFMSGRSQAVRLPKAYRFEVDEVLIEPQPDGALLLRPRNKRPLGERLRTLLQALPTDPTFERPPQPPLERDAAWWDEHGLDGAKRSARRRKSRAKR
ncbi:MAG: AbrB/MazE/SpoVT family DNA-binding domain-containing protein [Betaproteobacteria bacterium]|nr:AbrB/MazE/SpoVT family DNA-binding domain-containing protein [Betaproteobacteria bacterium]